MSAKWRKRKQTVNQNSEKWMLTHSRRIADDQAHGKQIYRLPNGVYAVEKENSQKETAANYRVTNTLYGTSKDVSASSSDAAKRKALEEIKSSAYTHEQLKKHLSAERI